jgi:hypothetical protein
VTQSLRTSARETGATTRGCRGYPTGRRDPNLISERYAKRARNAEHISVPNQQPYPKGCRGSSPDAALYSVATRARCPSTNPFGSPKTTITWCSPVGFSTANIFRKAGGQRHQGINLGADDPAPNWLHCRQFLRHEGRRGKGKGRRETGRPVSLNSQTRRSGPRRVLATHRQEASPVLVHWSRSFARPDHPSLGVLLRLMVFFRPQLDWCRPAEETHQN